MQKAERQKEHVPGQLKLSSAPVPSLRQDNVGALSQPGRRHSLIQKTDIRHCNGANHSEPQDDQE